VEVGALQHDGPPLSACVGSPFLEGNGGVRGLRPSAPAPIRVNFWQMRACIATQPPCSASRQVPARCCQLDPRPRQLDPRPRQLPAWRRQLSARRRQLSAQSRQLPARRCQLHARSRQLPARSRQLPARRLQLPARSRQLPARPLQLPARRCHLAGRPCEETARQARVVCCWSGIAVSALWPAGRQRSQTIRDLLAALRKGIHPRKAAAVAGAGARQLFRFRGLKVDALPWV
jgi:hypothetical protein